MMTTAWYVRFIFWLQKKKYGAVLNSATVWAKSPKIFLALSILYGLLDRKSSPLTASLRSLIIVRVSQMNSCAFCINLNTNVLLSRGVSAEKITALSDWQSSDLFTDQERATLEYTEAVTESNTPISKKLKSQIQYFFTDTELVELTALIAFQNMSTKFNNAFDIESQNFCTDLDLNKN